MHNTCSKEDIIKYVDDAEEFAKLPNGPVKEAVKELKTLKTSSNGQYDQFLDDFENGVDLSKLGSGGVKAWKVAINSPIKTDVSWLTRIDNWLADGADAAKDTALKYLPQVIIDIENKSLQSSYYDQALENRVPATWKGKWVKNPELLLEEIPIKDRYWLKEST